MYKILRTVLFFFPAEGVHHFSMKVLKVLCSWGLMKRLITWACLPESEGSAAAAAAGQGDVPARDAAAAIPAGRGGGLGREAFGLRFRNGIGLGAGFDKNALYLRELEALGFGFVEIGTVTPRPQTGNERPRLFRLPEDQALINRMGFNNEGVEVIAERLKRWRQKDGRKSDRRPRQGGANGPTERGGTGPTESDSGRAPMIIGGNIGKNKTTPNEEAWKDYEICFRALFGEVDYFVVNVSSPNTPGLRELQEKDALRKILTHLQRINGELAKERGIRPKPLLLKIAPDLSQPQIDDVLGLAMEIQLDGLVAANTTISREGLLSSRSRLETIGAGGLSGAPLKGRSTEIVRYIHEQTGGRIPVIASGGIFTGEDAREKMAAGAILVQVWTGFIYEGPFIVRRIGRAL
jgi:dihydroorotate dehydrogenase